MAGLIEKLHKIGDVINTVARVALGVTSIALCIAVIGQFILRWFGATMPWATEFSCYIFVWTTMLGSAVASRHLLHIGVDMVINLCHGKTRQFMLVLADVILLFALVYLQFQVGTIQLHRFHIWERRSRFRWRSFMQPFRSAVSL